MKMRESTPTEDAMASWECLMMVRDALEAKIDMVGCPPMFYPEAIQRACGLAFRAGVAAVYREHGLVPSERDYDRLRRPAAAIMQQHRSR